MAAHARLQDPVPPAARPLPGQIRALCRRVPALLVLLVLAASMPLTTGSARAEDRVTVRGNYHRETSTRVLQPLVTFRKELPDERFALETEYLLDVISSASIAAGALALGGDKVFTEMRHEATLRATTKIDDWSASAYYLYSTETDYTANSFGVSVARELLQRTATVSLSYSASFDQVYRITNNIGARSPWTSSRDTNLLQVHYLNLGYSHVLHKQVLAGVTVEGKYAEGPQDNPYRRARNGDPEIHPWVRRRLAPSLWLRAAVPGAKMFVEPHYRFYADDWGVVGHAADMRVHFRPHRNLALRLRYRFYTQSEATFWRDDGVWAADYPWRSDDPKLDDFRSHTVGLKLTWHLDGIAKFQGLGWLDGAWIQANYNHVFVRCDDLSATCSDQDFGYGPVRSTRYGDQRIGNLAFSVAF
ncbi:hypothetical protein ENSA5_07880 [Enhygromyxa salina]|uniref:DUF3570 domain-containing protein n=1 Tax=Enhygromyxa salina TaxID=215803 RepID=A0A2S9YGZ1_9BACT|nr:DUF3570 domain-containing protein [Enhygromyxa salina]PRQ04385.1 hypothetical protein ENSA5_07880 [Enhygromyxa salina]